MNTEGKTHGTAYRLKLYPTPEQRNAMGRHAGAVRWLWNHLLGLQRETYKASARFVFGAEMQKLLPALKRREGFEWLADTHVHTLQRVCKTLDRALKDSFKTGKGFPRFKAKHRSRATFYVSNEAFRVDRSADDGRAAGRIRLPKVGSVKFRAGRLPEGRILGATVSFDGRSWWIAVQCEVESAVAPGSATVSAEDSVGIDLGLASLVTTFDGETVTHVAAPRRLRKALRKLRRAQRVLSNRKKGSARRRKQADKVRSLHRDVANQRADFHHKLSRGIADRYSAVCVEDLNVKGMAANRSLALSVADAALGEFLRQLAYKVTRNGGHLAVIGRFDPSSQTCSACGHRRTGEEKLTLSERTFRCVSDACGHVADRDANAAANIRRLGLVTLGVHVPHERTATVLNPTSKTSRRAAPGGRGRKRAPSTPDPGYGDGRTRNPAAKVAGHIRESECAGINRV